MHLKSPVKNNFKFLILDTPLWPGIMSTNLKNPNDQDDCKKGMLSNQPQLTCVMPTALLGSRKRQPIEGMTSLRTNFEMHVYGQGYSEKHVQPVNAVTHLLGDEDYDVGLSKVKASAAKEIVARKKPHGDCESSQAQECQLEVIAMTDKSNTPQMEAEAMASRAHMLTCTIAPGKVQGTYWDRMTCKERFENPTRAVKRQAQISPIS